MDAVYYDSNDMVKIGCNDCKGCFSCCQGMGESVVIDPYDIWQLETHLSATLAELMQDKIEFHITDGLILPHIKMAGDSERCAFLNKEGRCSIHPFRPGLCRCFPLGRNYEAHKLSYFILEDACPNTNHMKMKIKKWLDIPDNRSYEKFLVIWHDLRKELQRKIAENEPDSPNSLNSLDNTDIMKKINMDMLHIFYERQYAAENFYGQFEERTEQFEEILTAKF